MAKIISITGDLGSGKSTVSNLLCKRLGYDYIHTGKIQREIADRYNMTTLELNKYSETHPEIDEEIDSAIKSLNESANIIADSRLAWFFVPKSFKVFLKTNLIISAHRISDDNQRGNEKYSSKEEAASKIIARKASENKRYLELYGASYSDLSNFNLVIDTSFITPEKVAEIILAEYEMWLVSNECSKAFISPTNLYPTQSIHGQNDDYDLNLPIIAVTINLFDYIFDGHKRTSAAIKNKIDLIPVAFKNENSCFSEGLTYKDAILRSIKPSLFREWEKFNSFKYLIYPTI